LATIITKQELERFLEHVRLYAPEHVFILDVPVIDIQTKRLVAGMAGFKDHQRVVLFTPQATMLVASHETLHATGAGEFLAYLLMKPMLRIAELRGAVDRKLREVVYMNCPGCSVCFGLSKITGKPVEHWVRQRWP